MESWTDINRQEFLSDIKNEYLNLRNKKLEEYEDLKAKSRAVGKEAKP